MAVTAIDTYLRPGTIAEAWRILRDSGGRARIVGGGTDLSLHPSAGVTTLVDLAPLDLRHITTPDDGGLRFDAGVTLTEMLEHPAAAGHLDGVIAEMLIHVGSPLLRNVATIGGHLARGRLSDVIPLFLALGATVDVFDGDSHRLSLEDYYDDGVYRRTAILTAVGLPPPPAGAGASFLRFSRTAFDLATINGACLVAPDDGVVSTARIAVGETPARGRLVPEAAEGLLGTTLDDAARRRAASTAREVVETGDDQRAGAAYRSHLVEVVVRRCLEIAAGRMRR